MSGIYDTLGLCSERTNPETREKEWFYSGGWHNQEWMDTYGPGCILDADWGQVMNMIKMDMRINLYQLLYYFLK